MEAFNSISEAVVHHLWLVSWQVAILAAIIWIVDSLNVRRSSLFSYWLWFIVFVRLCIPVTTIIPKYPRFFRETGFMNVNQVLHLDNIVITSLSPLVSGNTIEDVSNTTFTIFGFLWLSVVVLLFLFVLAKIVTIKRLLKMSKPVENSALNNLFMQLKQKMNIGHSVKLFAIKNEVIDVPAVIGIFRPRIVIPCKIIDNWNESELEPIILHELAHIKRKDLIVNFLQTIIQIIYFFNPFVWFANYRIRRIREEICDDIALHLYDKGRRYYTTSVLKVMEEAIAEPVLGFIGFMEKKNSLIERIQRIMKKDYTSNITLTGRSAFILAIVFILSLLLACKGNIITTKRGDSAETQKTAVSSKEIITIFVKGNDDYYVNDILATSSDLGNVLLNEMKNKNTKSVYVTCDEASTGKDIIFAMDTAQKSGVTSMAEAKETLFKTAESTGSTITVTNPSVYKGNIITAKSAVSSQKDITIFVKGNDDYYVNNILATSSDLGNVLLNEMKNKNTKSVYVTCDEASTGKDIIFAMDTAQKSGVTSMAVSKETLFKTTESTKSTITVRNPRDTKK